MTAASQTAYEIVDWDRHYETAESRKRKELFWVRVPVGRLSKRYMRLMRMEDGPAIFGVWVAVLQLAATMPRRGLLIDQRGEPLSVIDIEDETSMPADTISRALDVLTSDRVGWMRSISVADAVAKETQAAKASSGTSAKPKPAGANKPARTLVEAIYAAYPRKAARAAALKAISAALVKASQPGHEGNANPAAWLLARVEAYAASPAGRSPPKDAGDFRPHPATWFNQERYHDDPAEWQHPNGASDAQNRSRNTQRSNAATGGLQGNAASADERARIDAAAGAPL